MSLASNVLALAFAGAGVPAPTGDDATTYHLYVAAESSDEVYHVRFDGERAEDAVEAARVL